jgi:acyl carrier protein
MGMDVVELVMAVEERFGITIRDDEAPGIETVGDLAHVIVSRLTARAAHGCPTRAAFVALRNDARIIMRDPTLRIRPSDRIEAVMAARQRQSYWRCLRTHLGNAVPDLELSRTLHRLLIALALVLLAIGLIPLVIDAIYVPLSLSVALLVLFAAILFAGTYRNVPPTSMATFGCIARKMAGASVALTRTTVADPGQWVLAELRDIISRDFAIDPERIVPQARFVKDLGLD